MADDARFTIAPWVPAAIIWFGLSDATIYTVVLLGAVPSIANGLLAGMDQIPPIFLRAGQVMGAKGFPRIWRIVLPGPRSRSITAGGRT